MNKKFTKLIAALALLVFMTPTMAGWGQTYSVATSIAVGDEVVLVNAAVAKELSGISTSSYGTVENITNETPYGYYPLTVVAGNSEGTFAFKNGDKYLSWNSGNTLTTATSITANSSWTVSIDDNQIATIRNAKTNARMLQYNGSSSRFACYQSSSNQANGKLYKLDLSLEDNNLALTGAPVALSFDLNNNASAQVINYTTSSTGAVTVSASNYVTTVVDETAKTITVTPTAVTPSVQTITVSQAADATYNAGSVTFTVEVGDSTPTTIVTIDNTGITNTDVYLGTVAGSLSATVTSGGNAVPGATVTWSGDDDGVATISSDGTVTLVGVGTVSFTASYAGVPGQYQASSASYEMTVTSSEPYVQPTVIEASLNNSLFGTNYNGTASGITDDNPLTGTLDNVTVTYAGGGNHYVNNDQIRFYPSNKLTFDAPVGYEIKQIVFTASSWGITVKVGDETISSTTKTWSGSASQVVFIGSGSSGNCQMTMATITIGLPPTQYAITYDTDLTNGSFAIGNPTSAIEGASVSVATTPAEGYRLATMTYNDGTSHDASVSNNTGSFTMPASDVTVSATFELIPENVATFTDGVYSEPMATQASFDNWYAYSKTGDQVWDYYSLYSCARMSGYINSTNYENEDWFVSPKMLVENGKLQVSFNCAGAYGESTMISAKYSTNYPGYGDPNNYTWTDVTTNPALPYNGNLNVLESNVVTCNIEGLANNTNIYFAFKYTSTNSKAGTFEVKNFIAKQYYTITVGTPTNGSIEVDPEAKQVVGGTVLIEATPNENCHFVSWNIEPTVTIEEGAFTMPAANVTVNATFEENATYTVSYSVNGSIIDDFTEQVDYGQFATLWNSEYVDASATVPAGYTFVGWSTSAGSNETVSSFSPLADATLYAVLLMDNAPAIYVKVTSLDDITAGTYFIVNAGYVLPNADATSGGPVKSDDYKITTPLSDSYSSLPVAGTEWTFTGTNTAMTIKNSTTGHYLYVSGSNNNGLRVSTTSDTWSFAENGSGFSMKDDSNNRYCATYKDGSDWRSYNSATAVNYGDGGVLYLYKLTIPEITYTYIAEIDDPDEPVTLSSIEPTYLITVENGGVLTLTGPNNGDASNLVIKDGGQLKVYTTGAKDGGVQATVEKYIGQYTADDNGWNFIASPLTSAFAPDATMTSNTYDLYQLNNTKWENWKESTDPEHPSTNPEFNLINGRGYLYANSENVTLSFPGAVKPFNTVTPTANQVAVSAGWNLIGNPYTFNVFVNQPYYSISQAQAGITAQTTASNTDDIAPCTAVLVKANEAGYVTFYETLPSTNNNGNLNLVVAQAASNRGNATTLDNAIVSFNEGSQLEKFYFGTQNANLYIPQGTEEYAIVSTEAQGEMPVSFRANENGQYTLTVNAENVEMNYLHLIDNMTGADIDLLQTPSYTFNAKTTDYESRFRLVFAANNEDGSSTGSETFSFFSNGNWIISNEGEATLQVIDITGRILSSETVNGSVSKSIDAPAGMYVLRLINGDSVRTQKIVVR